MMAWRIDLEGRRASIFYPIQSMYGMFTFIYFIYHENQPIGYRLSSSWKMDLELSAVHRCPEN